MNWVSTSVQKSTHFYHLLYCFLRIAQLLISLYVYDVNSPSQFLDCGTVKLVQSIQDTLGSTEMYTYRCSPDSRNLFVSPLPLVQTVDAAVSSRKPSASSPWPLPPGGMLRFSRGQTRNAVSPLLVLVWLDILEIPPRGSGGEPDQKPEQSQLAPPPHDFASNVNQAGLKWSITVLHIPGAVSTGYTPMTRS